MSQLSPSSSTNLLSILGQLIFLSVLHEEKHGPGGLRGMLVSKILEIRSQDCRDRQEKPEGGQNRKAIQRSHTRSRESDSCNRKKARKNSDLRQDGQPAPPFSTYSPGEPGKFSHKKQKCCFCSSQGREGHTQSGLIALHPGPGARHATVPPRQHQGGSGRDRRGPCPRALDRDGQSQTQGGFLS